MFINNMEYEKYKHMSKCMQEVIWHQCKIPTPKSRILGIWEVPMAQE